MIAILRDSLSWLSGTQLATTAVRLFDQIPDSRRKVLRVLTWHRILPETEAAGRYPGVISTAPDEFAVQMQFIRDSYNVVSIDEVLAALNGDGQLPKHAVLLTFDDAYNDFATYAFPILQRMGLPVTLFVATAFPDNPHLSFWWNRLYEGAVSTKRREPIEIGDEILLLETPRQRHNTGRQLVRTIRQMPHDDAMAEVDRICVELDSDATSNDVLSWDALRTLAKAGVTLAPHTQTHPLLNRLPNDAARREVAGSVADLTREVGDCPPVFAYPAGGFTKDTIEMLRDLKIEAAFTTDRGINDLRSGNRMSLHRINVGRRANETVIRLKMNRIGSSVLSCLRPIRQANG